MFLDLRRADGTGFVLRTSAIGSIQFLAPDLLSVNGQRVEGDDATRVIAWMEKEIVEYEANLQRHTKEMKRLNEHLREVWGSRRTAGEESATEAPVGPAAGSETSARRTRGPARRRQPHVAGRRGDRTSPYRDRQAAIAGQAPTVHGEPGVSGGERRQAQASEQLPAPGGPTSRKYLTQGDSR